MEHVERPDGARIAWWSTGPRDGPPVLLIMGLAFPAAMWFRILSALAAEHRVVTMDNRGAGHTGDVAGPYTVPVMAADCLAVLDAAGVTDKVHVVGLSMGGLIAQELAHTSPERLQSLCLMATHAGVAHAEFDLEALTLLQSRAGQSVRDAAETAVPFNYARGTSRAEIEEDWAVRLPLAASPGGYLAQLTGSAAWDGYDRLPALELPTLVVHGDVDRLVPPANGRTLAAHIPDAQLTLIANANHVLMTDQPDQVTAVLLDWFARHAPRVSPAPRSRSADEGR